MTDNSEVIDTPKEPHSKIIDHVGWIGLNGRYYPCDPQNEYQHKEMAIEICAYFYPEYQNLSDYGTDGGIQNFLVNQGWIRTDVESIWFHHRPNQKQIDTMFDLYELECLSLPRNQLRLILAWLGLGFLSKPGDDYVQLEMDLPEEEQTPGFSPPKLVEPSETTGRPGYTSLRITRKEE